MANHMEKKMENDMETGGSTTTEVGSSAVSQKQNGNYYGIWVI